MYRKQFLLGLFGCLFITVAASSAHAMKCGSRVISKGDSRARVRSLCGAPVNTHVRVDRGATMHAVPQSRFATHQRRQMRVSPHDSHARHRRPARVTVEQWTFKKGRRNSTNTIVFRNGRVAEIKTQRRNHGTSQRR